MYVFFFLLATLAVKKESIYARRFLFGKRMPNARRHVGVVTNRNQVPHSLGSTVRPSTNDNDNDERTIME